MNAPVGGRLEVRGVWERAAHCVPVVASMGGCRPPACAVVTAEVLDVESRDRSWCRRRCRRSQVIYAVGEVARLVETRGALELVDAWASALQFPPGPSQVLKMLAPCRHAAWTVGVPTRAMDRVATANPGTPALVPSGPSRPPPSLDERARVASSLGSDRLCDSAAVPQMAVRCQGKNSGKCVSGETRQASRRECVHTESDADRRSSDRARGGPGIPWSAGAGPAPTGGGRPLSGAAESGLDRRRGGGDGSDGRASA